MGGGGVYQPLSPLVYSKYIKNDLELLHFFNFIVVKKKNYYSQDGGQ